MHTVQNMYKGMFIAFKVSFKKMCLQCLRVTLVPLLPSRGAVLPSGEGPRRVEDNPRGREEDRQGGPVLRRREEGCLGKRSATSFFLLPLNDFSQFADHNCHWIVELSFSRISESTTGYTFTPCVGSFTSPGIDTR